MLKKIVLFLFAVMLISPNNVYAFNRTTKPTKSVYNNHYISPYFIVNLQNVFVPSYKGLYKIEQKYGGKNRQTVLKNIKVANRYHNMGNGMYPLIPIGNFGGKLKKTGTIKIVFGISGSDVGNLFETYGNIYYIEKYANLHKEKYKISLVLYGSMAKILNDNRINPVISPYAPKVTSPLTVMTALSRLNKWGVKIYVCYNALIHTHLIRYMIPSYVKTVPMGILKIYTLRKKGYMYFTNP